MSWQPPPSYPPPPPPPPQPLPTAGRPGELGERFVARIIDAILLGVVVGPLSLIITVLASGSAGSRWLGSAVTTLVGAVLGLGYFAILESTRGQTVGKMVLGLRTTGPSGGLPTLQQALTRNLWMALSVISVLPVLGGLIAGVAQLVAVITIAVGINSNTATRQAWNDTLAGTSVVKTR